MNDRIDISRYPLRNISLRLINQKPNISKNIQEENTQVSFHKFLKIFIKTSIYQSQQSLLLHVLEQNALMWLVPSNVNVNLDSKSLLDNAVTLTNASLVNMTVLQLPQEYFQKFKFKCN